MKTRMIAVAGLLGMMLSTAAPTADAAVMVYEFTLAPEAAQATGSGGGTASYDDAARSLALDLSFSGLSGLTTVAHIHCCVPVPGTGTVGVAVAPGTLPLFPTGVSSGAYARVIDLSDPASYTSTFLTANGGTAATGEAALIAAFDAGTAYLNIHTSTFGGGEIRGFLAAQQVPEAGPLALVLSGLLAVAAAGRRRR